MSLTIYGSARSRTIRTLWAAKELGLAYQQVDIPPGPQGSRLPEIMAINPNGHIPFIVDDGVMIAESLAINLYLARKAGGALAASNLAEDGLITMWSFWASNEVEPHALQALYHTIYHPVDQRDPNVVAAALAALRAPLDVLEAHLATSGGYLVGGRFTIADINLASVIFYLRGNPEALTSRPHIRAWYDMALARPKAKEAFALRGD